MKSHLPRAGFTLIELLIVIALLGALAIGLIGALDPLDQLKKGSDTAVRDLVNQSQTAVIRYYAIKNRFPWCDAAGNCTDPTQAKMNDAAMDASITEMINAGELKSDFKTIHSDRLDDVILTGNSTTNDVIACYKPGSKAFQAEPNTKFNIDGTAATGCKSAGGTALCYWCVR